MLPANAYLLGWIAAIASLLPAGRYRKTLPAIGDGRLNALARKASLPRWHWPTALANHPNPMRAAREHALRQTGWKQTEVDKHGYATFRAGRQYLRVGPFGAIYLGKNGWDQMPRDAREELTERGRDAMIQSAAEDARLLAERRRETINRHFSKEHHP